MQSGQVWAQCSPGGLNDGPLQATTNGVTFSVFYTADTNSADYFPTTKADWLRDLLPNTHDRFVNVYGIRAPYSNLLPDYYAHVYDYNDNGWAHAYANCIVIESDSFVNRTEPQLRKSAAHEVYHTVQRRYLCDLTDTCMQDDISIGGNFGSWVSEGQCRFMDDRHFPDLDTADFSGAFDDAAVDTLAAPGESVFDKSYDAALFWSYCAEQVGNVAIEPQIGVDLLEDWWETVVANGTNSEQASLAAFKELLNAKGRSLSEIFHDYAICNVAREYDVNPLPDAERYRYLDEQPGHGTNYAGNVSKTTLAAFPASGNGTVALCAADYYRIPVSADQECKVVGFQVEADEPIGFALLATDTSGKALILSKQTGTEYGRTIIVSTSAPISRLDAVVAGLEDDAQYSYAFGSGTISMQLIRPTFDHQAYPGPAADPGRFLTRVRVLGPAELTPDGQTNLSVRGLIDTDFTVRVGTNDAEVLSTGYVGSEYWLTVQAPTQSTDNAAYDITVELCGQTARSTFGVFYGDVQLDHVVVLDNSGSMDAPAGTTKLDAAKAAAKLYIDSVSDGEGIAVVAFSGDGVECNDDARTFGTNKLFSANSLTRALFKFGVDTITPSNLTSIGDGLAKAENTFKTATNRPAAITNRYVLLLSDGMENEQLYWEQTNATCSKPALKTTFPATDIKVNAIAFGPGSDQPLMQEIGQLTDGDHAYVDVADTGSRPPTAAGTTASPSMPNDLKDTFLRMLENATGLERVQSGVVPLVAGTNIVSFHVVDTDIEEGLFYFGWDDPTLGASVDLLDPQTNSLETTATKRSDAEHKVYSLTNGVTNGTYTALVNAPHSAQLIYGLLCRSYKGLQLDLLFSQIRKGTAQGLFADDGSFDQGVPVTLLALLTDRQGAVLGATVDVLVTLPNGVQACGPIRLYDDGVHGDHEAGDGVYGAVFAKTDQAAGILNPSTDDLDLNPDAPIPQRGTYRVTVLAAGKANTGDTFTRRAHGSFTVAKPRGKRCRLRRPSRSVGKILRDPD